MEEGEGNREQTKRQRNKKHKQHQQNAPNDCGYLTPSGAGQSRMSYSQLRDQYQYRGDCPDSGPPDRGYFGGSPHNRPYNDQPYDGQAYGAGPGGQQYGSPHGGPPYGSPHGGHQYYGQQYGSPQFGQQYGSPHVGHQYGRPIDGQQYYDPQYGGQPYGSPQQQYMTNPGDRQNSGRGGRSNTRENQQQDPGQDKSRRNPAKQNKKPKQQFEPYWSKEKVQEGLKKQTLIEGPIRINPKNYEDAYIPHPDGHSDVYISGMRNRNRALNGDVVAVLLHDKDEWKVNKDDIADLTDEVSQSMEQVSVSDPPQTDIPADRVSDPSQTDTPADMVGDTGTTVVDTPSTNIVPQPSGSQDNGHPDKDSNTAPSVDNSDVAKDSNTPQADGSKSNNKKHSAKTEPSKGARSKHDKTPGKPRTERKEKTPAKKKYTTLADMKSQSTSNIPDKVLQRTAKVVYIIERKHSRACTGFIKPVQDKNPDLALFSPMDSRLPRILVPSADCPKDFVERPKDHEKTLFIAQITDWPETSMFAKGQLRRSLGEAGQIEPETEGMLIEYDVDDSEFSDKVLACLPQNLPWRIPEAEFSYRKDLRKQCIFSIDPATARDLDDALSCVPLGNGRYEIGVHIADVSFFVQPSNELDKVASSRATSVYLVQKVIPMLPRLLCEQLCSLNPDEDRLAFSVIWTITENGVVESEWFGRSVIRSCVKLSYDHAQGFIEDPDKEWSVDELPPISKGYTIPQIKNTVLQLQKVAKNLRRQRFENGALRLDQVKLQFALDKDSGLPCGYTVYQQRDSNRLVEEFMLLANMAVARKIYKEFPQISVLRRHPQPQTRMIDELGSLCRHLGVPIDVTSAKTIQESLSVYSGGDEQDQAKLLILTALCSKPMQNARYFCTGVIEEESMFLHYALNVPFYTHFTSPIRRYPDVMVHRLLAAALGYASPPEVPKGEIQKISEHCNDKKTTSKRLSELSNQLYFSIFVKECGPLEEHGMVMAVLDKAFDVLILRLGVINRVYMEKLPLLDFKYHKDRKTPNLHLIWKQDENHSQQRRQHITIFTPVNCRLIADPDPLKWHVIILHPDDQPATVEEAHTQATH